MSLFYLLLCLMVLGLGAIAFVITMEKKNASLDDSMTADNKPKTAPHEILNRLGLENSGSPKTPTKSDTLPEMFKRISTTKEPPPPSLLEDPLKSSVGIPKAVPIPIDTKTESELSLKYDELLTQHQELQEKLTKLEAMFAEKSSGLEKAEKTLTNELKNQKEFHKVKDILEKELKEAKDKIKDLQGNVATAQTETQTHINRITQLEEKVKKLEVEILTSEAAINDGQAGIQLVRKHATELEEKLRASENIILEKNQKIEDLVSRMNMHPTTNALPPEVIPVSSEEIVLTPHPEPIAKSTAETPIAAEEPPATAPETENAGDTVSLPPDIFANTKKEEPPTVPENSEKTPQIELTKDNKESTP